MTLWDVNPRLWHTHPMTEPIGLVVGLAVLLVAAVVGWAITRWTGKR